jgi:hypothetical protein
MFFLFIKNWVKKETKKSGVSKAAGAMLAGSIK